MITGVADGTDALTLTAGDILLSNGDFDLSGGDFNVTTDVGDSASFNSAASTTTAGALDLNFDSSTSSFIGLNLDFTMNNGTATDADQFAAKIAE